MKPLEGNNPLRPSLPLPPRPHPQPSSLPTAALGDASRQRMVGVDEKNLRAALLEVRETLARVLAEPHPLVQHLGLRHLVREAAVHTWDVSALSRPEEQDFARQFLAELPVRESASAQRLEPEARADLEVLLQYEQRVLEHGAAVERRDAAARAHAPLLEEHEGVVATLARLQHQQAQMGDAAAPRWQQTSMSVLGGGAAFVFVALLLLTARGDESVAGAKVVRGALVGAAAVVAAAAAWWARHPGLRSARLRAKIGHLQARLLDLDPRAREARQALQNALDLFARIDAELRAEALAVEAICRRHPGVRRYIAIGQPAT